MRAAGDLVQGLGQSGSHAGAEAGGEDNGGCLHGLPLVALTDVWRLKATPMSKSIAMLIGSIHVSECNKVARTLLLDLDGTLVDIPRRTLRPR